MNNVLTPVRCVWTGMLIGLVWKWRFFQFADKIYQSIPVRDDFFPALLQNASVLRWAYLGTIVSLIVAMTIRNSQTGTRTYWARLGYWARLIAAAGGCLGSTILICHQGSYNDMTFVTVWWCSVFSIWYSSRIGKDEPVNLIAKATTLSRVIVSLVFLGGAVGKWTNEYWSGQVLYEIYFLERDFWFFQQLRDQLTEDSLRDFATHYSRFVIVVESLGGLIWTFGYFLKSRTIALLTIIAFSAIGLLSNYLLFSVLAPMIGLAMVGWFDSRNRTSPSQR